MLWILKYQRTNHQFNLVFFVCHPIQGATHVVDDVMETKIGDVTRVIDFNSFANKATHDPICVCWYEEMRNYGVQNGLILSYFRVLNKHVFCMCMYIYIYIYLYTHSLHLIPSECFSEKTTWNYSLCFGPKDQSGNGASLMSWIQWSFKNYWWPRCIDIGKTWPRVMENIPIKHKEPQETASLHVIIVIHYLQVYEI